MLRPSGKFIWAALAALLVVAALVVHRLRSVSAPGQTVASSSAAASEPGAAEARLSAPAIPFADPHAAAVRVSSAASAWGGARTGSEATLSDRVVDYRIEARLDLGELCSEP